MSLPCNIIVINQARGLHLPHLPTPRFALFALLCIPSLAQAPVTPAYDVVSIRVDDRGPGSSGTEVRDGMYIATNVTMKDLLEQAFDIRQDLISGVPGPIDSLRFDVRAKVIEPDRDSIHKLSDSQRRAMLMPVLTERFHLKAHIEPKIQAIYELLLMKDGPRFRLSPNQASQDESTSVYDTSFKVRNTPMSVFAKTLAHQTHRTVVDKTGLTGIYDLDLKWSRDDLPPSDSNTAPTFFTAIQEQLGLKLQPAKGPVDTLVIDHLEMPSDN